MNSDNPPDDLAGRTRRLLDEAKYLTMATVSADGRPWSAVLQYAWLAAPLRFLFGSAIGSAHSRHIADRPEVSGSLFVAGKADGVAIASVDGAQFTGTCAEVAGDDLEHFHATIHEALLPDPRLRAEWMLPQSAFRAPAEHRLYLIEVDRWWLIDTRTWAQDRIDRRIEMPLMDIQTGH